MPASDSISFHCGVLKALRSALPGLDTLIRVQERGEGCCPSLQEGGEMRVYDVVIHLNDVHHWGREQIADWLDTLGVDLTFPVPKE